MVAVNKQEPGKCSGVWLALKKNMLPQAVLVEKPCGRYRGDSGFLFRFCAWFTKSHYQPVESHVIASSGGGRGNSSQGLIERQVWSAQIQSKCFTQISPPPLYPPHHLRHPDNYTL